MSLLPVIPITLEDTSVLFPTGPSLANPKSGSLAARCLRIPNSRYITGGLALSCKYSRPLAASKAIFILVNQM